MHSSLFGQSLLTLLDLSPEEILSLLDTADRVKRERRAGEVHRRFEGKTMALIFEKRSTRTRCAFETAFAEEGGYPVFLSGQDIHLGVKETVEDTARVLGRMFDAIQFRGFAQRTVELLAEYSGVPVYNGLTDDYHPTQALADLQTFREAHGGFRGRRMAYVGDGRNNVATSLMIASAKVGLDIIIAAPEALAPRNETLAACQSLAEASGGAVEVAVDPKSAVKDADAIYTDVWVSMGEEEKSADRMALLAPYRVDAELMAATGKASTIFLHCLPAVRGNEVTDEVMDGSASRVFDQAENRKHTIKAVMLASLVQS
ncbi:MAG: ornithine carbamoyltransferase [Spirochaetaceae bacterium]